MDRRTFMACSLGTGTGLACAANWRSSIAAVAPPFGIALPAAQLTQAARQVAGSATGRTSINVRYLGARGDGRSDDTAVLQSALAHYDRVYLPPGIYRVNNLQLRSGNELFGAGQASVIQQAPGAQYAVSANPGRGGTPGPRNNLIRKYCFSS